MVGSAAMVLARTCRPMMAPECTCESVLAAMVPGAVAAPVAGVDVPHHDVREPDRTGGRDGGRVVVAVGRPEPPDRRDLGGPPPRRLAGDELATHAGVAEPGARRVGPGVRADAVTLLRRAPGHPRLRADVGSDHEERGVHAVRLERVEHARPHPGGPAVVERQCDALARSLDLVGHGGPAGVVVADEQGP